MKHTDDGASKQVADCKYRRMKKATFDVKWCNFKSAMDDWPDCLENVKIIKYQYEIVLLISDINFTI